MISLWYSNDLGEVQPQGTTVWKMKLLFQKGWLLIDQKREIYQQKKVVRAENTQVLEAACYVYIRCKERAVVSSLPDAIQSPQQR